MKSLRKQVTVLLAILLTKVHAHNWNGVQWRINVPDSTMTSTSSVQSKVQNPTTQAVRLIDWREWSQMKSSYVKTVGSAPLLIVDSSPEVVTQNSSPSTTTYVIPEATIETETTDFTTSSTFLSTTTTATTIEQPSTTTVDTETTTVKASPDVTLELRSLPDVLTLLKNLAVIPAVVRSFSSAAISPSGSTSADPPPVGNPLNAILTAQSQPRVDELRSRALSANSGYGGLSPAFVTAPSNDLEQPQVFSNRRAPITNVPAPIVPVNNGFRPRELSPSSPPLNNPHRLNIYGLEPQISSGGSYDAPMITVSNEAKKTRPRFDFSNLTVGEVEQLESIHRKLFHASRPSNFTESSLPHMLSPNINPPATSSPSPLPLSENSPTVVFKHTDQIQLPTLTAATTSNLPAQLGSSALKPEMIDELVMIKDIPNLDELTKGLDLSLLSRPGGFAVLKEQFMQRLIERSLVQKRLHRQRLRNRMN
ncbi:MAM domain-containing protein [Aphelenchoides besseyi]|nr:MAM domain-containing protein [Aphelenchoides besseyi]KAI6201626.1 MAM domain-containing protein [Aphelenchoides besseyi]